MTSLGPIFRDSCGKACSRCKQYKQYCEYEADASRKDNLSYICKPCNAVYKKEYRSRPEVKKAANIVRQKGTTREYKGRNTKHVRCPYQLKAKYGITLNDYDVMIDNQSNRCKICRVDFNSLINKDIHIDHSHITGIVRGLLCKSCNIMIGYARDSINTLQSAIKYLENINEHDFMV